MKTIQYIIITILIITAIVLSILYFKKNEKFGVDYNSGCDSKQTKKEQLSCRSFLSGEGCFKNVKGSVKANSGYNCSTLRSNQQQSNQQQSINEGVVD
jgi:hypothetical protein